MIGLNAANFFQAEMVGVVLPVLSAFLRESNWRYDAIGVATAAGALGTLIFQTPAGLITDRLSCRRWLFAVAAMITGFCFAIIPIIPHSYTWIDPLLFVAGAAQSFFAPLLGAVALALVACRSEFVSAQPAAGVRVFPLDRVSVGGVGVDVTTEFASQ
ncbi:MAG: MFS transporter, partial [Candidatus Sulfotelmatobacter sp.]